MVNFVYEVRNINDPILGETPRFASDKEAFELAKEFDGAEVYALCYDEDWNLVSEDKITEADMELPDGCDSCSGDNPANYDDEGNFRLPETDDDLDEEFKEYFFPKEFYDRFKWFRGSKADCLNFRNEYLNDNDWVEIVKEGNTENNEVPEYTINFTKDHLIKPELWDTLEHETIGDELKAARAKDETLVSDEAAEEHPVDECVKAPVQESKKIVESREPVALDVKQLEFDWMNDDAYYKGNKIIAYKVDPKEVEAERDQYSAENNDYNDDLAMFPMCENGYRTKAEWTEFIENAEDPYWMSWANLIDEYRYSLTEADLVYEGEELPVNESCESCKECGSCETQEDDDTLFNENFTPEEDEEFKNLSKTLGFKDFKDVLDFSKDHGSVFDRELLQSMREEAEKLASNSVDFETQFNNKN